MAGQPVTKATNAWLEDLFGAIDALDTERFLAFLCADAAFHYASAEPAVGHAAIRAAVSGFFSTIAGCKHTVSTVWEGDDSLVCEGRVTYTRHDGSTLTVPFADVFVRRDGKIGRYSIYIDINALYAG